MPPLFTVFTPTFNRRHTLGRVYGSLKAQTLQDFEWLIVDDGSSDGTDAMVSGWRLEAPFEIQYVYQQNAGKHVAHNRALEVARGDLFLTLDSDDACVPTALERLKFHWDSIPPALKDQFSGVTVLCVDEAGHLVGDEFPQAILDCNPFELTSSYDIRGEKWGFHRTEILRRFPFPVFNGETFVAEGVVWNRVGREYKVRCVNERLRLFFRSANGISASIRDLRVRNPRGARLYYQESLQSTGWSLVKWRQALNYVRFSLHAAVSPRRIIRESGRPALITAIYWVGYAVHLVERNVRSGASART